MYGPPVTTGATEVLVEIEETEDGALDERLKEPATMLEALTEMELVELIVETTELELELLEAVPLSWYISSLPPAMRE